MKRTHLNFVIDGLAFTAFFFLISTGLLLRYQLPAGSGGLRGFGVGGGAGERPIALLWGMTRHEWGQIHYLIAGSLIAILAAHVLLHWKWINCVIRGTRSEASGLRFGLGFSSLLALLLLGAMPLMISTNEVSRSQLQVQRSNGEHTGSPEGDIELRGSMTVLEVAEEAGITAAELLSRLNMTSDVSPDERVGRLLRQHGLQMSDLRDVIESGEYVATKETEP